MVCRLLTLTNALVLILILNGTLQADDSARPAARVKKTDDFQVTGDGGDPAWQRTDWISLNPRAGASHEYTARFKVLYSDTGIYFLFHGTDRILTASMQNDFDDLWNEDVFEVFLWPDETYPVYFEYEISPLNKELPIIIPNFGGKFYGWRPWHYEGDRRTKKGVKILGGPVSSGASIRGWTAEVFFPYDLLKPLQNVPPKSGSRWRANVYRVDYDDEQTTQWDWARVGPSFHEYKKFGTLVFE